VIFFQHPFGSGQAKDFFLVPPPETSEDMLAPGTGIWTIAIPGAFVKVDIVLDARLRLTTNQKAGIVYRLDISTVNNCTGSGDAAQSFTTPDRSSEIESVMTGKCHSIFKINDCAATEFKHGSPPIHRQKKGSPCLERSAGKQLEL
jgi:hypothetical protein